MSKISRHTKEKIVLKVWHKVLLLVFGVSSLIASMAVYEKSRWLFFVLALFGALIIFIALEGGRDLNRAAFYELKLYNKTLGVGSAASEKCLNKDKPTNPWDKISSN